MLVDDGEAIVELKVVSRALQRAVLMNMEFV